MQNYLLENNTIILRSSATTPGSSTYETVYMQALLLGCHKRGYETSIDNDAQETDNKGEKSHSINRNIRSQMWWMVLTIGPFANLSFYDSFILARVSAKLFESRPYLTSATANAYSAVIRYFYDYEQWK